MMDGLRRRVRRESWDLRLSPARVIHYCPADHRGCRSRPTGTRTKFMLKGGDAAMAKARTLFDKIWDAHLVDRQDDGTCLIYIDRHL